MKLTHFITRKAIIPHLKAKDKKAAIQELVQAMKKSGDGERFSVGSDYLMILILRSETRIGENGSANPNSRKPSTRLA